MYEHYPFVNMPLPYAFDALEPYIDAKTMELHHDRHLQTYIDNLNGILKQYPELQELTLEQLIFNTYMFPQNIQVPIANNAGGVYNHQFYFAGLTDVFGELPQGEVARAIDDQFGGYESFKTAFKTAALSVFGSGYAWLTLGKDGKLKIMTTPNQNTPLTEGLCPILNSDVWEHAYYLKHYNKRTDYVDDWFNVVNWDKAGKNYLECMRKINFFTCQKISSDFPGI